MGPRGRRRTRGSGADCLNAPTDRAPVPRRAHRTPGRRAGERGRPHGVPLERADRGPGRDPRTDTGPTPSRPRPPNRARPTPTPSRASAEPTRALGRAHPLSPARNRRPPPASPPPPPRAPPTPPAASSSCSRTGRTPSAVVSKVRKRDGVNADRSFTRAFRGFSAKLDKKQKRELLADPNVARGRPRRGRPSDPDHPDRHLARRWPDQHPGRHRRLRPAGRRRRRDRRHRDHRGPRPQRRRRLQLLDHGPQRLA